MSSAGVSDACTELLRAALPYALKTPPSERHDYQAKVLDHFKEAIESAKTTLSQAVDAIAAKQADLEKSQAAHSENLERASTDEAEKTKEKEDAASSEKLAGSALATAEEALSKEKADLAKGEEAKADHVKASDEYVKTLEENWDPAKAGTFGGMQWRKRDQIVDKLANLLVQANAAKSLVAALPAALKEKPSSRGPFALRVIDVGEAALRKHVDVMATQLEELQAQAAKAQEGVDQAGAVVATAAEALSGAQQASIDAQNAWLDASTALAALKGVDYMSQFASIAKEAVAAKEAVVAFEKAVATWEAEVAPPAEPAAAAPDAAATATEAAPGLQEAAPKIPEAAAPTAEMPEAVAAGA